MNLLPFLGNVLFMITTPLLAYAFRKFFPKEINPIIGYRTKRSMASQKAWLEANRYAANLLVRYSLLILLLQVTLLFFFNPRISLLSAIGLLITALIVTLIQTEIHLKKSLN
jgi:uncharacterized membrane protein